MGWDRNSATLLTFLHILARLNGWRTEPNPSPPRFPRKSVDHIVRCSAAKPATVVKHCARWCWKISAYPRDEHLSILPKTTVWHWNWNCVLFIQRTNTALKWVSVQNEDLRKKWKHFWGTLVSPKLKWIIFPRYKNMFTQELTSWVTNSLEAKKAEICDPHRTADETRLLICYMWYECTA